MEITPITIYKFNGKKYRNLAAIKTEVENRIGAIIDYADMTLTPKQKLNLLKAIANKKAELHKLLDITFTIESVSAMSDYDKNILDL